MIGTTHLRLAEALSRYRKGYAEKVLLNGVLTAAQAGTALRLIELDAIYVAESSMLQIKAFRAAIEVEFNQTSRTWRQIHECFDDHEELEQTIGLWLFCPDEIARAKIGYWLACVFLRGLSESETILLTQFLIGERISSSHSLIRTSVRRYPTGGVSEKQALLLPAFLRYVSDLYEWCSPFLVARRLAHTGGTYDKLATLPEMKFATIDDFQAWTGVTLPVRYFAAGGDFCPRDAELYRLRGETGTVHELGLMAASIMSKQVALPAEVIVLDVLFGPTAFLESRREAEHFVNLCKTVGDQFGLSISPEYRWTDSALGKCIGNVVEVFEAAQLLHEYAAYNVPREMLPKELRISLRFMEVFAREKMLDPVQVISDCEDGLRSGRIFDALITLWTEHGVSEAFMKKVAVCPRDALLGNLQRGLILATRSGIVAGWNSVAIADVINNVVNAYVVAPSGEILGASRGGIEIAAMPGRAVRYGSQLAVVYFEHYLSSEVLSSLEQLFDIRAELR